MFKSLFYRVTHAIYTFVFWEGQEAPCFGFFWNMVLGNILIHTSKKMGRWCHDYCQLRSSIPLAMLLGILFWIYKWVAILYSVKEHPGYD